MELTPDDAVEIARQSLKPKWRVEAKSCKVIEYPECFSVSFEVPATYQPFPARLRVEVNKVTRRAVQMLRR